MFPWFGPPEVFLSSLWPEARLQAACKHLGQGSDAKGGGAMKRTAMLVTAAALVAVLAAPASAQEGTLGPWKSGQQPTQMVDCDGDGTPETSIVVSIARAAEGSAAFGRPGIGHIEGSTSKSVALEITAHLLVNGVAVMELPAPPGVRQAGMGTGSWGHGAERDFSCSFIGFEETDPDGNLIQIRVTVSGLQTP